MNNVYPWIWFGRLRYKMTTVGISAMRIYGTSAGAMGLLETEMTFDQVSLLYKVNARWHETCADANWRDRSFLQHSSFISAR